MTSGQQYKYKSCLHPLFKFRRNLVFSTTVSVTAVLIQSVHGEQSYTLQISDVTPLPPPTERFKIAHWAIYLRSPGDVPPHPTPTHTHAEKSGWIKIGDTSGTLSFGQVRHVVTGKQTTNPCVAPSSDLHPTAAIC